MPLIDATPRALDFREILRSALEESLRENGKLRGYASETEAKSPRMGPDGQRQGILSFATMRRIHRQNDLVRAVVRTKARQIVSLDWDIQRADAERFAPMGLARQIKRLFRMPNMDREDWTAFAMKFLVDALVLDAGVIEKVRDSAGNLVELVARDGATFTPKVDKHGRLQGYRQVIRDWKGAEQPVDFKPEDIVYLKFDPQTESIWGLSPIETLAITIGGDILAMAKNVNWLQDGNLADNILVLGRIGATALAQFKAGIQQEGGEFGKLPTLYDLEDGGTGAKILPLRATNKDMQFLELSRWFLQRICAVYSVAESDVIELEAKATKATAEQQAETGRQKSLKPELDIIAGRFSADIVQEFHPNLCFRFTEADKTDELEEAQAWQLKAGSGWTINELRADAGRKPLSGPLVEVNGQQVNAYDLPLNLSSGQVLGLKGPNPLDALLGDSGGGDPFDDSEKSSARAGVTKAAGRRRSSGNPARYALAAYEAHRANLAKRAEARLRRAGIEDALAARSEVPPAIPRPGEGSLSR